MNKRLLIAAVVAAWMPSASLAQEDVAAETARVNSEKARLDLAKSRADALSPLGAISGSADIKDSDKTAHGVRLRDAAYRAAAIRMVSSIGCSAAVHPIVIFGTTPPSVSAWWEFKGTKQALSDNLDVAIADYNRAAAKQDKADAAAKKAGTAYLAFVNPMAIKLLTTVAGALVPQDSYSGATLKLPDAALGAVVRQELASFHCGFDSSDFQVDASDRAGEYLKDLRGRYETAKTDLVDYKDRVSKLEKLEDKSPLAKAGANLTTVIADYEALRKALYADAGGRSKADMIYQAELLAGSKRAERPILYIVDQDASLTTRAREGVRTLFASPVDLTAVATIRFVLVKSDTPGVETVSCLLAPKSFEGALTYSPETGAPQCVQLTDARRLSRSSFSAGAPTPAYPDASN